jgi:hypothetical protein
MTSEQITEPNLHTIAKPPLCLPCLLTRLAVALVALILIVGGLLYSKREYVVLGAEAYMYGYPLVVMDVTRSNFALNNGPTNALRRVPMFPDANYKDVVRPNVDTLYTVAFIDMAQGPWVFEMASNDQRYEVMPFYDAWTNVFATLGSRTGESKGGKFMLVGPGWQGAVPSGLTLLRSPTNLAWLIGRTQTNGTADYPLVHKLQAGYRLRSLADWQANHDEVVPAWNPAPVKPLPPATQLQQLTAEAFFTRLTLLMRDNPPAEADAPMMEKFRRIGLAVGQPPQWSSLEKWAVGLGIAIANREVAKELAKPKDTINGWSTPPMILGNYGTFYNTRAVVAMIALGANLPADSIYPSALIDADGKQLDSKYRYVLHFEKEQIPPVKAFWSVTTYDMEHFLVANPLNRYALGDRDPLHFNADGSLDLLLQAQSPGGDKESNWLPIPANGQFQLTARLYWPKAEALEGRWHMPAIRRLD